MDLNINNLRQGTNRMILGHGENGHERITHHIRLMKLCRKFFYKTIYSNKKVNVYA